MKKSLLLRDYAHARSGDKGSDVNIGVIAKSADDYHFLKKHLSSAKVKDFFAVVCKGEVVRYELPNLRAFNFMLHGALGQGGSSSLRSDAQGKAFGEALLHLVFEAAD
jgi:hypothetical protein